MRFKQFKGAEGKTHTGVGIHAGRVGNEDGLHRKGPAHATNGCVRTNDAAMTKIESTAKTDPLTETKVVNNRPSPPPMRLKLGR